MRGRGLAVLIGVMALLVGCATADPPPETTNAPGAGWVELADAPTRRTEVAAAVLDGTIYVMGGFDPGGGTVALVEVFDPVADTWHRGPDLPIGLNHAMAAALPGTVVVAGGYTGPGLQNPSNRVFTMVDGDWTELPPLPEPRAAGGLAVAGEVVYAVGGIGEGGALLETMSTWRPGAERWTGPLPGPLTPREHLGVTGDGEAVYTVGGRVQFQGNLAAFERFDPVVGAWEELPDLPTARGGLGAAFGGGMVVAVGGEAQSTFEEVEGFDLAAGEWRELPPLPTPRHGLGVVVMDDTLYVIAGGPEPGYAFSGVVEALDLASSE